MVFHDFFEFFSKGFRVKQILHAQRTACDFVLIGRANPTPRGANFCRATLDFARLIDRDVIRQNQSTRFRYAQTRAYIDTSRLEFANFFEQGFGTEHHTIANKAWQTRVHNARWNQAQNGFLTIDNQGVTRVVTTLKAHHALGGL